MQCKNNNKLRISALFNFTQVRQLYDKLKSCKLWQHVVLPRGNGACIILKKKKNTYSGTCKVSLIAPSLNKGLTTTDYNMLFSSKLPGLCTCPFIFLPLLRLTELHCPKISLTWGCRPLLKLSILSPLSSSLIGPVYSYNVY